VSGLFPEPPTFKLPIQMELPSISWLENIPAS
jgi:hypothetical protein